MTEKVAQKFVNQREIYFKGDRYNFKIDWRKRDMSPTEF
jgi:hypothetical protein